ncbi:GNAT family N-acetyltransferase [Aestuariibius sp. 2305UL40-4]|uniref:GNAT family N-acetyltransferase n=1 Tax=Aestuariibius violaceus TaxID=3234132 RepID=UPI00345EF970
MIELRPFKLDQAASARRLMHDAIRIGAAELYDADQRSAWSPSPAPGPEWRDRLADHITIMAFEVLPEIDVLAGFGTIRRDGYLDLLFVAPNQRRSGLAGRLHDALLDGLTDPLPERLTTRASLYARPFLERRGWVVTAEDPQTRGEATLPAYAMERPYKLL